MGRAEDGGRQGLRELRGAMTARRMIGYIYPLYDPQDSHVEIILPRDLTADECARLCALLLTLVIPHVDAPTANRAE